ncbi:MAG: DUF3298 and DUF4163 domain-containing protein [Abditibacteriota bacterium]|nr:DUF3298 and DUF4163 domain-containing protein [Abditibacteriota bacterium]
MKKLCAVVLLFFAAAMLSGMEYENKTVKKSKKGEYYVSLVYPFLTASDDFAAAVNKDIKGDMDRNLREFEGIIKEVDYGHGFEFELTASPEVTLNTEDVFSVRNLLFSYTGGAHPNTVTICGNYLRGMQRSLLFSDLFKPGSKRKIAGLLKKQLDKERSARIEDPDLDEESKTVRVEDIEGCINSFVLTDIGVNWIFDPYAVGSYAEGRYEATLSWKELKDFLEPLPAIEAVCAEFGKHTRLTGTLVLPENSLTPAGSELCACILAYPPEGPEEVVIDWKKEIPAGWGSEVVFDVLAPLPSAETAPISFAVLYDGALAFSKNMAYPRDGFPEGTVIELEDLSADLVKEGKTEDLDYMLYSCKAVYVDKTQLSPDAYIEVRLLDGDSILKKRFTKEYLFNPAEISVCFNVSALDKEKEYALKVLLREGEKTLFESEKLPFKRGTWRSLPEDIRLIKKEDAK